MRFALLPPVILLLAGCNRDLAPDPGSAAPSGSAFPVRVRVPERLTAIDAPGPEAQTIRIACVTCHSLRQGAPLPTRATELREFHSGLVFSHGSLSCASCHSREAPAERLHLADGRELQMVEVLTLCSQCHGTHRRDFDRGAHGGMKGHWDLSRGGRERNSCVDCHDPHAPRFVGGMPVHPPRDRFLGGPHG